MSLNKISIYIERNTKIEYRKYTIYKATLYLKTILLLVFQILIQWIYGDLSGGHVIQLWRYAAGARQL